MIVKLFEIRDRMTFIPVMGVRIDAYNEVDPNRYLLRTMGFGSVVCILLTHLGTSESHWDVYDWHSSTMQQAHNHIQQNFDALENGAVVDVEFITGATAEPKKSQRLDA